MQPADQAASQAADHVVGRVAGRAVDRRRWLARLSMLAAGSAIGFLLIAGGLQSLVLLGIGVCGVAVALAAAWWFVSRRGVRRWVAAVVAVTAPATIAVWYVRAGLIWVFAIAALLWCLATVSARAALRSSDGGAPSRDRCDPAPSPRHPYLIMNSRSGGGKVARFGLVERARQAGAEVVLLPAGEVDVVALATAAVRAGADLLGVAGGDGTQALVAGVAAEYDVPFLVIAAGTRNHFAMDLGLDRDDPAAGLDALSDGVELRVDLGQIGRRTFVNNASFGAYAAVVQSPKYRNDKARTTLDVLPDLLAVPETISGSTRREPVLRLSTEAISVTGPQAVLVSNNPYASGEVANPGRRTGLDGGVLGVVAVSIRGAAAAAGLVLGRRSAGLTVTTAHDVVVESDTSMIPVAVDGEALLMPTPVRCRIRPRALRVRVPRNRPGVPTPRPTVHWRRLARLALR